MPVALNFGRRTPGRNSLFLSCQAASIIQRDVLDKCIVLAMRIGSSSSIICASLYNKETCNPIETIFNCDTGFVYKHHNDLC